MLSSIAIQLLAGLAEASSLFLVAAGLSLIFGVTRIVNFAHGSLYMLGLYVAYSVVRFMGQTPVGFWASVLIAALAIGLLGVIVEVLLLRRIYQAPELFQLLATFALVLIFNDAALWIWGAEDLLAPPAPGLNGAVRILGNFYPKYDIVLIFAGPVVLLLLWALLTRTRWGGLVRAATQDREMLGALGINEAWLFTIVFGIGAMLAGLGGAIQSPRIPANLALDMSVIGDAFVIVVVGGLGSIPGAYVAALIIALLKTICIAIGVVNVFGIDFAFPKLTLVVEFIFMAVVLVFKPWGLFGRAQDTSRNSNPVEQPLRQASPVLKTVFAIALVALVLVPLAKGEFPYLQVLIIDALIATLFAASLHFMMGPGGMVSFGHAAYYGLGAYAAGLLFKSAGAPIGLAVLGSWFVVVFFAILFGWFCVRLTGVYLAMLTLAFAEIVWASVYQWDSLTGGSNGLVGVWPPNWLGENMQYYVILAAMALGVFLMRRILFSPFGLAMRGGRDSPLRAEAVGINVKRVQWVAFTLAGLFAGVAGSLFVFAKGGAAPESLDIGKSVDALMMVLLGGVQALSGPLVGAAVFTGLEDYLIGATTYWHALFGLIILFIVLLLPNGLASISQLAGRLRKRDAEARS